MIRKGLPHKAQGWGGTENTHHTGLMGQTIVEGPHLLPGGQAPHSRRLISTPYKTLPCQGHSLGLLDVRHLGVLPKLPLQELLQGPRLVRP